MSKGIRYVLTLVLAVFVFQVHVFGVGVWIERNEFMSHYTNSFFTNFPTQVTHRSIMNQRCNSILNTKLPGDNVNTIEGFYYGGWNTSSDIYYGYDELANPRGYYSPVNSLFIYTMCQNFVENSKVFSKELTGIFKESNPLKYLPKTITTKCPLSTKGNDLTQCPLDELGHQNIIMLINDILSINLATYGYFYNDTNDLNRINKLLFRFTVADTFTGLNIGIGCDLDMPLLGPGMSQHCGTPNTFAYINSIAKAGATQASKTKILSSTSILALECLSEPTNVFLGCGFNDPRSLQSTLTLLNNEIMMYQMFTTFYQQMLYQRDLLNRRYPGINTDMQELLIKQQKDTDIMRISILNKTINPLFEHLINTINKHTTTIGLMATQEKIELLNPTIQGFTNNGALGIANKTNTVKKE